MQFKGTKNYISTDDLSMAVNASVALERPLLIKGEPGTGKTLLAIEVAEALGLEENQYITSFQSRLAAAGREWLKPYTSELMEKLPEEGVKKILILSPGFSMDCLETIEEIDEENKEIFLDSGGEAFHYIACLNDNDEHVEAINNLITNKISQL